jgi:hypothetical protein
MPLLATAALLASASGYDTVELRGWTLQVDKALLAEEQLWSRTRDELDVQLYRIVRTVPEPALGKIRQVTVWVHRKAPWTRCMAYHPGRGFLVEHGMNPDMAKGIEVGDARTFLVWTLDQPWMVLHELAHAYHDQHLEKGFQNPPLLAAYRAAMEKKLYTQVMGWKGPDREAYAATNQMEYFAELTEAWFGQNDMFPFVRGELIRHDPGGAKAVAEAWGAEIIGKKGTLALDIG